MIEFSFTDYTAEAFISRPYRQKVSCPGIKNSWTFHVMTMDAEDPYVDGENESAIRGDHLFMTFNDPVRMADR